MPATLNNYKFCSWERHTFCSLFYRNSTRSWLLLSLYPNANNGNDPGLPMPWIPAPRRLRQEYFKFEASMVLKAKQNKMKGNG
jgi:hypothetical protein